MAGSQARLDGPLEVEHRADDRERALAARAIAAGDDALGVDPEGPGTPLGGRGPGRGGGRGRALAARAIAAGDDALGVDPEGPETPLGELVPGAGVDPDRVVADESR